MKFVNWGLIDYEQALTQQEELVELVASGTEPSTVVFCTHSPIVTLGRKTVEGDLFAWQGPVKEISRGGRATYHGPSQLVVYPVLKVKDIHAYLRNFEDAIVETLKSYGIESVGKSLQGKEEETGVWVGNKKIASLGIAVRKWVSYHGAAINLDFDPEAFVGMKPCGFNREVMVSLEELIEKKIDRQEFSDKLKQNLTQVFTQNRLAPFKDSLPS